MGAVATGLRYGRRVAANTLSEERESTAAGLERESGSESWRLCGAPESRQGGLSFQRSGAAKREAAELGRWFWTAARVCRMLARNLVRWPRPQGDARCLLFPKPRYSSSRTPR